MKWQYDTISRGGGSIIERLQNEFPDEDISDFISFYSLRNYGMLIIFLKYFYYIF